MSVSRRYLGSATVLLVQSVASKVLGLASQMVLSRSLSPVAFGAYSAAANTAAFGYMVAKLGVDTGMHVLIAEESAESLTDRRGAVMSAGLLLATTAGLTSIVVLAVAGRLIARRLFGDESLGGVLRLAGAVIALQCLTQFAYAAFAGLHRFGRFAAVTLAVAALSAPAYWVGARLGGATGAMVATVVTAALGFVGLMISLRAMLRAEGIALRTRGLADAAREILRVGGPLYLAGFTFVPAAFLMQGYLSRNSGVQAVGYLRVSVACTTIVSFVPTSVAGAMISTLAALRHQPDGGAERFLRFALVNAKLAGGLCLCLVPVVLPLVPAAIAALFGRRYLPAASTTQIGICAGVLTVISGVVMNALYAERSAHVVFGAYAAYSAVFAVVGALCIPRLGAAGYALGDLAGWAIATISLLLPLARRAARSGIASAPVAWLGVLLVAAFAIGGSLAWADAPVIVRAGAGLLASVGLLVAFVGRVLTSDERSAVLSVSQRAAGSLPILSRLLQTS